MKNFIFNFNASVLAVFFILSVMLLGSDSESMLLYFMTKAVGILIAVAGGFLGAKWAHEGKFGEVTE